MFGVNVQTPKSECFLHFRNRHFCSLTRINPGNQDREKLNAGSIKMGDCPLCAWKSTYIGGKEVTCVMYGKRYAFSARRSSSSTGCPRIGNVRRELVDATNVTGRNTPAAKKNLFLPPETARQCIQRDWFRSIFHTDWRTHQQIKIYSVFICILVILRYFQ